MATTKPVPRLRMPGVVAQQLGVLLYRVLSILATRQRIWPTAEAGQLRLYAADALARLRYELNFIDARRPNAGGGDDG